MKEKPLCFDRYNFKKIYRAIKSGLVLTAIISVFLMSALVSAKEAPKIVRVSCGINNSLWLDDEGKINGFFADYMEQLARQNNWTVQYVDGSWNESVNRLLNNEIDILIPTQKTAEREDSMNFSSIIAGYQQIVIYAKESSDYYLDDFEEFDGTRIAVTQGTSNELALREYAEKKGFSYNAVYIDSSADKCKALDNGEVDLIVFSSFNDVSGYKIVGVIDSQPFYLATSKDNTELVSQIDSGMQEMLMMTPELAGRSYSAADYGLRQIAYSKEESEYVAQNNEVKIGFYNETAPLSEVKKDGTYSGIYIDILKKLKESSGLNIVLHPIERSEYGYDLLNSGEIDFLIGSSERAIDASGNNSIIATNHVMDYNTVAITRQRFKFGESKAARFALTSARKYWNEYIEVNYPDSEIIYYETSKDCLTAIEQNRADVTLLNTLEFNYQSKNPRFQNLIEWETFRLTSYTVMAARSDVNPVLLSVINKGLERISQNEISSSVYYHLNTAYHSNDARDWAYNFRYVFVIVLFGVLLTVVIVLVISKMHRRNMVVLQEKNRQLEIANEAKTRFLSRISHEIRTPINVIIGLTDLIRDKLSENPELNAETLSDAEEISDSSNYLLRIVNDILDTSSIESGKFTLYKSVWNPEHYLEHIYDMIKPITDKKNIDFSVERQTNCGVNYYGDGIRVEQILVNILNNSVKFTPEGGKIKLVAKTLENDGKKSTLQFEISDTGIGMDKDFVDNKLFQPFNQENNGKTSPFAGTGLGLSISRELSRMMDGDITCRSEKGKGTTFTVTIVVENSDGDDSDNQIGACEDVDLRGKRILLCEDHPMNRKITVKLLEKKGAEVDVASNGKIGLEKFEGSDLNFYDAILMDIRMPEMDGLEAARLIRKSDRSDAQTVPIIAMSANAYDEDRKESLNSGMNFHLAKPVKPDEMYSVLSKFINEKSN